MSGLEDGCEAGCKVFTGGEKKHHPDCVHYPESLTKLNHDRIEALEAEVARLAAMIEAHKVEARYAETGNLWRFWSDKVRLYVSKNADLLAENDRLRGELRKIADDFTGSARDMAEKALGENGGAK